MMREKVTGEGRGRAMVGLAAAVALGLALWGCAPGYVTSSDAPVNVYIAAINGGSVLDSDVRSGPSSSLICEDEVAVAIAVRNKNPKAPAPNVPSAVLFTSYEVRYFRTDGRGTEGLDVPYRITGNLAAAVDVSDKDTVEIRIEIVRRQAKLEPPLSTINQATVLTLMAKVTLYGETVAGQHVSAAGTMQIDFADFVDKNTECPVPGKKE